MPADSYSSLMAGCRRSPEITSQLPKFGVITESEAREPGPDGGPAARTPRRGGRGTVPIRGWSPGPARGRRACPTQVSVPGLREVQLRLDTTTVRNSEAGGRTRRGRALAALGPWPGAAPG
eukprot:757944-Hanusia_phi.AAC.5